MNRISKSFFLNLAAICTLAGSLGAQTITGSFTGTLTDPSGSILPKAKITATNTGTNVSYTANTNDAGIYNVLFLPIGEYRLTAELAGFKKAQLGPFRLEVNQIARVDIKMEIGDVSQSVEVTGVAPILQTEATQTGQSLTAEKLTALPLKSRNFVALTLLIPGAVSPNPEGMNSRFGARPYVNGNREQTNNFMLDGVDVNDSIDNRVGYSPNVDALEEVKVITGNAAGEFGNAGGAAVVMNLKSGTNQFRGNVFHFIRNNVLDANGFFRNRSAATARRQDFRQNIYGFTFGGPIQKDKLFFFTDFEGTKTRSGGTTNATVAPQAWRNGDLSIFPQNITDPTTGQLFPGKIIPQSRFSPVARALYGNQALYPLPNQQGVGPLGVTNNYGAGFRNTLNNDQGDIKIDWRPNDKDAFSARYSRGFFESFGSQAALPVQMTSGQDGPTQSVVLNWNRTLSPTIVNEARVAYSRIGILDRAIDWSGQLGTDANQRFGIPGGQPIAGLSSIAMGSGLTPLGGAGVLSTTYDNKFIYYDNLTWQKGKHLIKLGGQFIRYQQNRYYSGNNGVLGLFRYSGDYTGLDFADFLTDNLRSKGRGALTGAWGHRFWRSAFFVQDDYKVTSNFTLNIGLRWEYMQPIYEVADRQVNVDTFAGRVIAPGSGEFGRALYKGYPHQYMPRLGFAWTPGMFGNKLVVRGGYAYQSFMEGTGANLRLPLNPPLFVESDITYDIRQPSSITRGFSDVVTANVTLDGPRPPGVTTPQLQGRAWDLNLRPQTTSQYNFTLEYQLDNATSFSAGYVAQKGTHLVAPVEANQPLPGVGAPSTWAPLNDRRPLRNSLPNLGNIARTESSATMDYHSLQVTARRRMRGGLEFLAAYTYGKTLTDNLGYYGSALTQGEGAYWQNAYDRRSNRGPSFFDIRQNFTIGGLYEAPFGKNKKWNFGGSRAADLILGGWLLNYNTAIRSGLPITVRAQDSSNMAVRGNIRANAFRPFQVNESARNVDNWFGLPPVLADRQALFCLTAGTDDGRCAYGNPGAGQFGTGGIGTERGPGFFNLDLALGKRFTVTERQFLEFRAEFFNALNTVSWAPPGFNLTNVASIGQIGSQVQNPRQIQFGLKYFF